MLSLPQYLIVNAGFNRYVLFEPSFEKNHVRMIPVKNPRNHIQNFMNGGGGMLERNEYTHVRKTSEGDMLYTTVMEKLDIYVNTDVFGKIYRYIIEKPNLTLPVEYYNVYTGKDQASEWHVIITYEPPKVPKAVPVPKYVLKGFVDSLITSKESCPITMDELKAGDISLTKCYHAFSRGSIEHIMKTTKRCPTCRTELDNIELF
jgi:hypothetical protein